MLASSATVDEGRFLPGTVLAGRYRIGGLLGRGGMGEVYRATDLTLGQAVALKFLPESLARDDRALARFYNEVRIAHQVTHPNVCRVYDIGEVEGLHYISMEYVDGEDLGVLLRRIGRLPADKAMETARRLCAGLAAAHEKGVLHRDLKPANIMIDGRGNVIIMDFGLAGLSEQLQGDIRSGTPAYMSPEQLAGTEVTVKSDIYALGLLLYELFTGKRAFEAASLVELMQMQEKAAPASITSVVKDLDPAVERVILRCLQPDPRQRPGSALAVAAALPGGDPLAAALAAGETPSPELIAAAGETEGLRPVVALAAFAAALIGIAVIGVLGVRFSITQKIPLDLSTEALSRDSRTMLKSFGYSAKPADTARGWTYNGEFRGWLKGRPEVAAARWKNPAAGEPPLILFWYRESPKSMAAVRGFSTAIGFADPPLEISGMARLQTDHEGRLQRLDFVPAQVEPPAPAPSEPFDWSTLFRAAALDMNRFQTAEPQWTPLANADTRAAWTGTDPDTGVQLRIEAAAWRGKPIFFRIVGPWTTPERTNPGDTNQRIGVLIIVYAALISASLIAWRNFRTGRGDRKGALKLAFFYFSCMAGSQILSAHHSATLEELGLFWKSVSIGTINAAIVWAFYLALEPWVRRVWPQTLISWSRYTTHGIRDPLVGRDILFGVVLGSLAAGLKLAQVWLNRGGEPMFPILRPLSGTRQAISDVLDDCSGTLIDTLLFFFILFIARVLLRKQWLAAVGTTAVLTGIFIAGSANALRDLPLTALFAALYVGMLLRLGLLATIAGALVWQVLLEFPRTLDFSSWYAAGGMAPLVAMVLLAFYGFRTSLAGRRLLKDDAI
jgi:serine/threonine-protein kinase